VKALTYVEIDVPYCTLTYGETPCQAAMAPQFVHGEVRLDPVNQSVYTFDDVFIGLDTVDRKKIVIGVATNGIESGTTMTIGGVSATLVPGVGTSTLRTKFFEIDGQAVVGETADVVVTFPTGRSRCYVWSGAIYSKSDVTGQVAGAGHNSTPASPATVTVDVDANDLVLAIVDVFDSNGEFTWTGIDRVFQMMGETTNGISGAAILAANNVASYDVTVENHGSSTTVLGLQVVSFRNDREVTGTYKCFNTKATCQDRVNFSEETITTRFGKNTGYLPTDIDCVPNLLEVSHTPGTIDLGKSLGTRSSIRATFRDHPSPDTGPGGDKYVAEREYDPIQTGTFWGKFRARQKFLTGQALRLLRGFLGLQTSEMETHHFVVESFDGPNEDGVYSIVAKDPLKKLDGDRAQAPNLSEGFLREPITDVATTLTLSPTDIGSTYPTSGIAAIGGKEIVTFTRAEGVGNDQYTRVYTPMNNPFTDLGVAASVTHTWTNVNSVNVDTTNFAPVTGNASSRLFNGSTQAFVLNDNVDVTLLSLDFTIDLWFRTTATSGSIKELAGQADSSVTAALSSWYIRRNASNFIEAGVSNGTSWVVLTGATQYTDALNTGWHHVALEREGDTISLIVDGVVVDTDTFTGDVNDSTQTLGLGRLGSTNSAANWQGNIDEFRFSSNVARYGSGQETAPPTAQYNQQSWDIITITRAQFNTEAEAHDEQDRFQICLQYDGVDAADILYDLMVNYADVDPALIPLSSWQFETAAFYQRVNSALIAEPTSVRKLVDELIEQVALAMWWDDENELIRLQVLRQIPTSAKRVDENNIMKGTLSVVDQPDKRIDEVWTYYGMINPLDSVDDPSNYRSAVADFDLQMQTDYKTPATKIIFARWIAAGARSTAQRLNGIQIGRFKNAPRRVSFALFRSAQEEMFPGDGARLWHRKIQDPRGILEAMPLQVTRVDKTESVVKIEAEEMIFDVASDFNSRILYVEVNTDQINLRDYYDEVYPAPTAGAVVDLYIENRQTLYSSVRTGPSLVIGDWPNGVTINIRLRPLSVIHGYGGRGGDGRGNGNGGDPGESGGSAIYTRYPINLYLETGALIGGGGGGGGGGGSGSIGISTYTKGGNGGDGAGRNVGGNYTVPTLGLSGGANAGRGGDGGATGTNGEHGKPGKVLGINIPGGDEGIAGAAIDGASFITVMQNDGSILGPQIN